MLRSRSSVETVKMTLQDAFTHGRGGSAWSRAFVDGSRTTRLGFPGKGHVSRSRAYSSVGRRARRTVDTVVESFHFGLSTSTMS